MSQQFVITRNLLTRKEEETPVNALSPAEKKFHCVRRKKRHSSCEKRLDLTHLRWV